MTATATAAPTLRGPVRGVLWIHNAILAETNSFEETVRGLGWSNPEDASVALDKFRFLRRVLEFHEQSEDRDVFPPLEERYGHVADTYEYDHRRQQALYARIESALRDLGAPQPDRGALLDQLRRESVAFATAMELHVAKENELLYPLYDQLFSPEEQTAMSARAMQENPPPADLMPQIVPWMFRLQSVEDREDLARFYLTMFPPEGRPGLVKMMSSGVTPNEWSDIVRRVPELAA